MAVDPDYYTLEVLVAIPIRAYQADGDGSFSVSFTVITSTGIKHEATISNGEIVHSNGGIRCIRGSLVVGGEAVGTGVVFTDRTQEKSFCCFCYPNTG